MPYINIALFPGQNKEMKAKIAEKFTDIIRQELRVPDDKIWVTFSEIPADEWSIGGKMCGGEKSKP